MENRYHTVKNTFYLYQKIFRLYHGVMIRSNNQAQCFRGRAHGDVTMLILTLLRGWWAAINRDLGDKLR